MGAEMRAVYILWLRQLKRYSRSRSRMIGSLGQPLLFLLALGFGFAPTFSKAGGGSYITFITPGIISMGILFTAVFSGIEIIWDRQFGFLKETLVAPVSRIGIVLGRVLGGATVAMIQGCRFRRSMQHPSGRLIWQYVQAGRSLGLRFAFT
jgi:ABC-2 type transport system permease protein